VWVGACGACVHVFWLALLLVCLESGGGTGSRTAGRPSENDSWARMRIYE
jgi:hypothetical protein